jgi:hypothetical protein
MTTKTIPEYLEDERRKPTEAQLRTEEEAARTRRHITHTIAPPNNLRQHRHVKPKL